MIIKDQPLYDIILHKILWGIQKRGKTRNNFFVNLLSMVKKDLWVKIIRHNIKTIRKA